MKQILFLLLLPAGAALAQSADTAHGKQLFEQKGCYQCHGHEAQGGLAGARLAQTKLPQPAFIAYVRNPRSGGMPPFRAKVLSDQDLGDIYSFIKTIPEPKPAKDIPLLNQH